MRSIYAGVLICLLNSTLAGEANAQTIQIPDKNFKEALIALGHDTNGDGEIQKNEAAKVTRLYVNKADISSLVGIKQFTNLEEFGFYENSIRSVDLEGMTKLRAIYGWSNGMALLKIKGCTKLETIYLFDNKLRAVDLTGLPLLKEVKLDRNILERIDLSNCSKLEELDLNHNTITEIKLTGANVLRILKLEENYIFEMNLSPFTKLEEVYLTDNPIKKIEVRGLKALKYLRLAGRKYPSTITQLNTCGLVSLVNYDW